MKFQEIMIFTFQSGTIQAYKSDSFDCLHGGTLHSNLVQFKRVKAMISIQDGIYFTFQSGTIQADGHMPSWQSRRNLYIPIWYNSSKEIPKGTVNRILTLHSNLVQFKPHPSKTL